MPSKCRRSLTKSFHMQFSQQMSLLRMVLKQVFPPLHNFISTRMLMKVFPIDLISMNADSSAVSELKVQKGLEDAFRKVDNKAKTYVFSTIEETVQMIRELEDPTQVLVTGSLHLVGGLLEVIEAKGEKI